MIQKPGIYFGMTAEAYHADPCPGPSLSSSIAHTLLTRSPRHAWTEHPRLNPAAVPEESAKFDLGSAAHALLLEGEDRMTVIPFKDYRKKEAADARDAARAAGRFPILEAVYETVFRMREEALKAILRCPDLSGITLGPPGRSEAVLAWQEGDLWMRARPDFLAGPRDFTLDYKTTAASANPDAWTRTMLNMGADFQAAFYMRGNAATGGPPVERQKWAFLVQEVDPPFACCLIGLSPLFLELAMEKVERAIALWHRCATTNEWPGYPERICYLEPPAWALASAEESRESGGIPYDPAKMFGTMNEKDPA